MRSLTGLAAQRTMLHDGPHNNRRNPIGSAPQPPAPTPLEPITTFTPISRNSLDEGGRSMRVKAIFAKEHKWATPRFPLIENHMTRTDCERWLSEYGSVPHVVPRSACTFCPYHSDEEWVRIKANAADWRRAVEVDRALRASGSIANRDMKQVMYLHDSCKPLDEVEFKPQERKQIALSFYRECEGVCGN